MTDVNKIILILAVFGLAFGLMVTTVAALAPGSDIDEFREHFFGIGDGHMGGHMSDGHMHDHHHGDYDHCDDDCDEHYHDEDCYHDEEDCPYY
jgi:hypothetical protein